MPKVKINADGVGYTLANPDPTLPPIYAAAYRGEVVEMSAAEVTRLRKVRVRVFYDDPLTGARNSAYREEPAVVDANEAETADAEALAAARKRVVDLEDQLAQARADLPLSVGASPPLASPLPVQGTARELPALDAPRLAVGDEPHAPTLAGSTPPAPPAPKAPAPPKR